MTENEIAKIIVDATYKIHVALEVSLNPFINALWFMNYKNETWQSMQSSQYK